MKAKFSTMWNSSVQPRKQRKYRYNAPAHVRSDFMVAPLADELRKQHKKRSIAVRKDDVVKVLVGTFKGKVGKVISVNRQKATAYIEGVERTRRDGTKVLAPVQVSNLMIVELYNDNRRLPKNA